MSGEVETYIAKPIKLLLSSEEDACEQLRMMLEESVSARYGARKAQAIANLTPSVGKVLKKRAGSISPEPVPVKKSKVEPVPKSKEPSPVVKIESESSDGADSEDLSLEILEENLCFICKNVSSTSKNKMLECLDCHNLCHQNCASPPVTADVNDPRFVWYCSNCNKGSSRVISGSSRVASSSSNLGTSSSSSKTSSKGSSSRSSSNSSSSSFAINKTFSGSKWGRRQ
ncbi:integrator complex subunit 12 [Nilaparvata lugens]|uniref:integrator complex subunit 12 n=1 Tax=Nilaparvata lugens TaxID=108931 RepID=UPI000B989C69|nr:integrator complex subunit 12 [Nilaparvata lugens]XP_022190594.1 integrator complex subunit 12 [Nilaparvata lugens]XP_039284329.1 integrator complex subunit 12 [Nilaparvata lugens]XP_039284330.1 integrator complex subunit 12 [Nilaparvata lugens]